MKEAAALRRIPFECPLDELPLEVGARTLTCANGHSFDVSAQGYVNLLPVQFKASRSPGDSKPMVDARRRVLDAGLFDPLADAVAEVVGEHMAGGGRDALLVDAGCGEGFYTARLARALPGPSPTVLGIDISKWAVTAAAKRHRHIAWAVASNRRIPVRRGSAAMITSLFGFETWEAWAALQSSGQRVTVVDAGPLHLIELREIIYESVRIHDAPPNDSALSSGYSLIAESGVRFGVGADGGGILADILEMTPHGHKSTAAAHAAVHSLDRLKLTIDALIRVYRRD
jgi:23S rRNA (guanine745-N1)-methyltransferase